jgi:glycosyltransferase involved in cell wall biosynthesis
MAYVLEYGYSMVAAFLMSLYVLLHDGFEVVHAHCPPDAFVFLAAFYKLLGKRFVYDHHDLAPELYCARFGGRSNRVVHGILLWLERLCCQLADHVIATNESYKAIEMRRGGVPEQRITVVRNGPGAHHMRLSKPVSGLRQDGRRILCYVGCIGFQDRVDYLLRALHHLLYTLGRADFLCVVVGAGEAWPALQELTDQLHLADHVHFVGWVQKEQVPSYISAADICVAPEPSNSYNDRSTAVKLVEYMATGKPIVAFDLPEHRFTAQDAAAYAQPNDELHFAQQIAALMDDPDRRRRMGQVGRQRVEAELAWQHQERKLLAAYQTVCGMDPVRT